MLSKRISFISLFIFLAIYFTFIKGQANNGSKKIRFRRNINDEIEKNDNDNDIDIDNDNSENNIIDEEEGEIPFQNYDEPIGPEEYSETKFVPIEEKMKVYKERVSEMFHFSYDNYIKYAFPNDELKPISCTGDNTWGNFSLTLVDALDTFAVMNDIEGFENALEKVEHINFDMDINVSVFETTIRILGGLLSAHLIAKDYGDKIKYHDELLVLAEDLGQRLLPAYDTPTGMPFGSVNLKRGVEPSETPITCTAAIGTCSIEFTWLSILTNNPIYEFTCRRAIHSLWSHRTVSGLIGIHVDVFTGRWIEASFAISGGIDSFFEYLLKAWIGFSDETEYGEMFLEMYELIHQYLRKDNGWHIYADAFYGKSIRQLFQSLGAYWPGVKVLAGELIESNEELHLLADYLRNKSFLPEHINIRYLNEETYVYNNYPLRPELVESLSVMYKATKDPKLLEVAFKQVDRLRKWCKTQCGYANVKNVYTVQIEDKMESFFLSETLKYLYLLFDPNNKFNKENYIFSTEAHPFPVVSSNKSQAKRYYRNETETIHKELEKINKKYDANKKFIIINDDDDNNNNNECQIHPWSCSTCPIFYRDPNKMRPSDKKYFSFISSDFKNYPMPRDTFYNFRKGICSYQHWINAKIIGLDSDESVLLDYYY